MSKQCDGVGFRLWLHTQFKGHLNICSSWILISHINILQWCPVMWGRNKSEFHTFQMSHYSKLYVIKLHHDFSIPGIGANDKTWSPTGSTLTLRTHCSCRWFTPPKKVPCPPSSQSSSPWLMFKDFFVALICLSAAKYKDKENAFFC